LIVNNGGPALAMRAGPTLRRQTTVKYFFLAIAIVTMLVDVVAADGRVTTLAVYPPDISLTTKADSQRFIVVATRDDGVTLDVTTQAAAKLVDSKLCRLDKSTVFPAADGETKLEVEYQGLKSAATVKVKDATAGRPTSFQLD